VLVFFSPGFRVAACAGSVVFVSSSLALLARSARGKVNFLLWSRNGQPRARPVFLFFFVGGI